MNGEIKNEGKTNRQLMIEALAKCPTELYLKKASGKAEGIPSCKCPIDGKVCPIQTNLEARSRCPIANGKCPTLPNLWW